MMHNSPTLARFIVQHQLAFRFKVQKDEGDEKRNRNLTQHLYKHLPCCMHYLNKNRKNSANLPFYWCSLFMWCLVCQIISRGKKGFPIRIELWINLASLDKQEKGFCTYWINEHPFISWWKLSSTCLNEYHRPLTWQPNL